MMVMNMVEDEANGNILPAQNLLNMPSSSPTVANSMTSSPQRISGSSTESFPSPGVKKKHTDFESKKLNRGISRATDNVNLVSQARSEIVIVDNYDQDYCIETPPHMFALPDLNSFPENFKNFLVKDLIAVSTQISLEQANRLNWWTSYCQRLWPLSTSGDGNCLLHAASLGMWGFHDRLLTLRKTLHGYLTLSPRREAIWRRWRWQQDQLNAQAGLVYSEVEWRQEWNAIVNMASTEPRLRRLSVQSEPGSDCLAGNIYESLEEIHVLALAHVLKRPIIVIADTVLKDMNGDALAPISFGGIYLPLECPPDECHRSPLLLAFDGGHFSALVSMDSPSTGLSSAIPLTDSSGDLLPLQFSVDPGNNGNDNESLKLNYSQNIDLLQRYLDLIKIDSQNAPVTEESKNGLLGSIGKQVGQKLKLKLSRSNSQRQAKSILCAALHSDKRHEYHDVMIRNYLETAKQRFELQQENEKVGEEQSGGKYNAGNSQFYTAVDTESHQRVSQLPLVKPAQPDPTLYLSNSTFYEEAISQPCRNQQCNFFGNPATLDYCSKCYQDYIGASNK
ncbi:OTU domain-containing protein 7B isoform X2 [Halyomorpha halys]|uniref:OTU domain-containing protein 7B isoform X2 n=1 Tax=Halyomorpha halys TaxID=286706 RepID=UPI000D0C7E7B|nr:OTU domain-containing protein 7B isoform X2 [Halyomorpha halys]